ncbi:hypothetical protein AN640_04085 [Candidatus Epulonipiscium fishelsonii]|uniref:Uncharacterized protein n=1 Tax=Candidatus Epulonipiscium fishelsonii TaxID=77094 RepID=A0ACC8XIK4_9FIRM|nr:hypothetical protein AN640_04085 [Epulopiscium sp. SCG-D08WGA-EpuloA1]
MNYAHRGYKKEYPENTLLSIRKAIVSGANGIEIDVHLSKDGELVVIHDEDVNRTFEGIGLVRDYTLEELKEFKNRDEREDGDCSIPTLQEVFNIVKPYKLPILIELKTDMIQYEGIEEAVIQLIKQNDYMEHSAIMGFNWDTIKKCRELDPDVRLGLSKHDRFNLDILDKAKEIDIQMLTLNYDILSPDIMVTLRDLGYEINVYTVNRKHDMKKMMDYEVHRIITDDPELLVSLLKEHE